MSPRMRLLPIVVVILSLAGTTLFAAVEPADASAGAASPGAIAKLVEQLDADAYSDREAASRELTAAGKAAIPVLQKAATSDALEVSSRSMRILRKLLGSSDEPTSAAARAAMEKIAQSKHPSAARAKEALRPAEQQVPWQGGGQGVVINLARKITVSNVNGVKTISVDENGRKVKIQDDPKKGIKVEVTETKGGKQVTKVTEAKNADELKKKDRQAHDLYKQYGQGKAGGAFQIQIQAGGIGGGGIQIMPVVPGAVPQKILPVPARAKIDAARRIDSAKRLLQHAGRQLEAAIDDAEETDELKTALDSFEQELKKQLEQIEKHRKPTAVEAENTEEE